MKVDYDDAKLKKICTSEREAKRRRADLAPKLRLRVNALDKAENVAHLMELDPLGNWHELTADRAGTWSGKLSGNWRLTFKPIIDGDALAATEVLVIEIIDYHG